MSFAERISEIRRQHQVVIFESGGDREDVSQPFLSLVQRKIGIRDKNLQKSRFSSSKKGKKG
jgi:hypothetical protein